MALNSAVEPMTGSTRLTLAECPTCCAIRECFCAGKVQDVAGADGLHHHAAVCRLAAHNAHAWLHRCKDAGYATDETPAANWDKNSIQRISRQLRQELQCYRSLPTCNLRIK